MPSQEKTADDLDDPDTTEVRIAVPRMSDGAAMWRIARDSGSLDLNSSYAYLLFCRDFASSSRLATVGGEPAGFILGYRRPERPECLFVWQVAVDERFRGRRISSLLLDDLVRGQGAGTVDTVETTITDDNAASQALFISFAKRWGADLGTSPLFAAEHFPDGHAAEPLYTIGPITSAASPPAPAAAAHDH